MSCEGDGEGEAELTLLKPSSHDSGMSQPMQGNKSGLPNETITLECGIQDYNLIEICEMWYTRIWKVYRNI